MSISRRVGTNLGMARQEKSQQCASWVPMSFDWHSRMFKQQPFLNRIVLTQTILEADRRVSEGDCHLKKATQPAPMLIFLLDVWFPE